MINPREICADAIIEIIENNGYNNMVLKKILKQNGAMSKKDKALVTEIVNGTLRNIIFIDYVINQISNTKTEKMKPFILAVLRTGVYQIFYLDKVPNEAVCNEAVKLTKKRGFTPLSGFINGVLRNIIRQKDNIKLPDEKTDKIGFLSVKYSYPQWIIEYLLSDQGIRPAAQATSESRYEFVKALCEKNNKPPDVTVAYNRLKCDKDELKNIFVKDNIIVKDRYFMPCALHISGMSDITANEAFRLGKFHIQDESSLLAVKVLDPKRGDIILDVCAAPGGKSLFAAEIMGNVGTVVSRDVFPHKITLIEENAARLGIDIIKAELKDGTVFYENDTEKFDKVIIDAPCSGFGIFRKKPDIKFKRKMRDIDELVKLQREILTVSGKYVKKDGFLVYCTCTISERENLENINWFIKNNPFKLCDITEFVPDKIRTGAPKEGFINLYPHIHNSDGFFIAKMIREE